MPPVGLRQADATDDGFTLIELIVALSIVFAVVASMIFLFVGSLKTVTQAKQRQTATALATQTLERSGHFLTTSSRRGEQEHGWIRRGPEHR